MNFPTQRTGQREYVNRNREFFFLYIGTGDAGTVHYRIDITTENYINDFVFLFFGFANNGF